MTAKHALDVEALDKVAARELWIHETKCRMIVFFMKYYITREIYRCFSGDAMESNYDKYGEIIKQKLVQFDASLKPSEMPSNDSDDSKSDSSSSSSSSEEEDDDEKVGNQKDESDKLTPMKNDSARFSRKRENAVLPVGLPTTNRRSSRRGSVTINIADSR